MKSRAKQIHKINGNFKKTVVLIFFVPTFIYMVGQIIRTTEDKRFDSGQFSNWDHESQNQYSYPKKGETSGSGQTNDNLHIKDGVAKNDIALNKNDSAVIEDNAAIPVENIDVEKLPDDVALLSSFLMDSSISGEYRSAVIRKLLSLGKKDIIMDLISANSDMPADLKRYTLAYLSLSVRSKSEASELIGAVEYSDEMYLITFYTLNHSENFTDKGMLVDEIIRQFDEKGIDESTDFEQARRPFIMITLLENFSRDKVILADYVNEKLIASIESSTANSRSSKNLSYLLSRLY